MNHQILPQTPLLEWTKYPISLHSEPGGLLDIEYRCYHCYTKFHIGTTAVCIHSEKFPRILLRCVQITTANLIILHTIFSLLFLPVPLSSKIKILVNWTLVSLSYFCLFLVCNILVRNDFFVFFFFLSFIRIKKSLLLLQSFFF